MGVSAQHNFRDDIKCAVLLRCLEVLHGRRRELQTALGRRSLVSHNDGRLYESLVLDAHGIQPRDKRSQAIGTAGGEVASASIMELLSKLSVIAFGHWRIGISLMILVKITF